MLERQTGSCLFTSSSTALGISKSLALLQHEAHAVKGAYNVGPAAALSSKPHSVTWW